MFCEWCGGDGDTTHDARYKSVYLVFAAQLMSANSLLITGAVCLLGSLPDSDIIQDAPLLITAEEEDKNMKRK